MRWHECKILLMAELLKFSFILERSSSSSPAVIQLKSPVLKSLDLVSHYCTNISRICDIINNERSIGISCKTHHFSDAKNIAENILNFFLLIYSYLLYLREALNIKVTSRLGTHNFAQGKRKEPSVTESRQSLNLQIN